MTNPFFSPRSPNRTRRSVISAVIVASALAVGACSSQEHGIPASDSGTGAPISAGSDTPDSAQPLVSDPGTDDSGLSDSGTTVSGYVRLQNGQPVAGEVC